MKNLFFTLITLITFVGCTNEEYIPSTEEYIPSTTSKNKVISSKQYLNYHLISLYKAGNSNDIYYSHFIPKTEKCVAIEKKITINNVDIQSSKSPSQVFFNNKLYVVYKAGRSNDIYYASFDGQTWTGNNRIKINGNNIQTSESPSCTVFNNKLYITYKGGRSNNVYYASFDGQTWTGDNKIKINGNSIQTSKTPSSVVFNNKLYIVYKAGRSNNTYYSYFNGQAWTGDNKIKINGSSIQTSKSPSCAVFNNKLYVVYKAGRSNNVYYASFDGQTWTGNNKIKVNGNNIQTSESPSCTVFENKLYTNYKAGRSNDIYYASFDGQTWTGDYKIHGIQTNSSPRLSLNYFYLKPFLSNLLSISPISQDVVFSSTKEYPYLGDADEHIQGIQSVNNNSFILSSSNYNNSTKKGLIVPIKNGIVEANNVKVTDGYGHAGGIQFNENTLVVALAEKASPSGSSKKIIRFFENNLSNITDFEFTSSDAQAAGYIDINTTERLIIVITTQAMDMEYKLLNKESNTWVSLTENWIKFSNNETFGKTQNINIFKEDDIYYLIGSRNAGTNKDALDVYTFSMNNSKITDFNLFGSIFLDGNNMRNAGGINIKDNSEIQITSFGKKINKGINKIHTYTN
ncbi:hypothetical protein [Zunongwangia endophytica]|uniref:BNR repeat-like domain-containing protein n=1 Tax=Zunongwangia endophytica TaxID=1808945 RepID=A0ABV8HDJ7_9FLAO|nr:hypothetical protein [Zunongwangia endophytica]MDN3594221.1 hypothetical protein [Zunongwangia endophytica]